MSPIPRALRPLAVAVVASVAATGVASGAPTLVWTSPNASIEELAYDGGRAAVAAGPLGCGRVVIVNIRTRTATQVTRSSRPAGPTCARGDRGFGPNVLAGRSLGPAIALAGRSALWRVYESGNSTYWHLIRGGLGQPETLLGEVVTDNGDDTGSAYVGVVGAKQLLVSGTGVSAVSGCDPAVDPACIPVINPITLSDRNGTALTDLVEVIPHGTDGTNVVALGPSSATVVNATGTPLYSFSFAGKPLAAAISGTRVVVVVDTAPGRALHSYVNGTLEHTTTLPAKTAADVDLEGALAVVHTRRKVLLVSAASGLTTTSVAIPAGVVADAELGGKRLVWAVNRNGIGRLRAKLVT